MAQDAELGGVSVRGDRLPRRRLTSAYARLKPRDDRIRKFHDSEARATMHAVKPRTMTSYARIFALVVATRYVVDQHVAGDVVECGVWWAEHAGRRAHVAERGVATASCTCSTPSRGCRRRPRRTGASRARRRASCSQAGPRTENIWAIAGLDDVRAGMAETDYPTDRVHYHPGLVQDTIPGDAPERIALLRLDTDWYASTLHELDHLYDRLVPGGVLIIDDYDYWEGSRQATDEFLAASGARLLLVPIDTARVAVKP